jgi:hypothetical protein
MNIHSRGNIARRARAPRRPSHSLFLSALILSLGAWSPASAQVVTGRIVGDSNAEFIEGAVVVLMTASGERTRGVLTDQNGRFALRAPAPGTYRIHAEMIGRRTAASEKFELDAGTAVVNLALVSVPIQLEEVLVRAASRCATNGEMGVATVAVWQEIQKALRAEAVTREMALYQFAIERAQRTRDPNTFEVIRNRVAHGTAVAESPFRTLPASEIAENGYAKVIQGQTIIYGPTPEILLSPEFQDTHCFSLKQKKDRIGLVFKPLPDRRVTDIEGVLWVDAKSAELERLEFKFKHIPRDLVIGQYSGFAEFERIRGGAWMIGKWRMSTPVTVAEGLVTGYEPFLGERPEPTLLTAVTEPGGTTSTLDADVELR